MSSPKNCDLELTESDGSSEEDQQEADTNSLLNLFLIIACVQRRMATSVRFVVSDSGTKRASSVI